MNEGSGYLHEAYALSLSEFGSPLALPRSGGWILRRPIPLADESDAMGCYPLFACRDWSQLERDLDALENELVSLAVVTDPFGDYGEELLRASFRDVVRPFKPHFVAELARPADEFISKHHRYYSRKALARVHVERLDDPARFAETWSELYACLVARHELAGVKAFSRASFEQQLRVPGIIVLQATHQGATVGAHLWYIQGDVAYSHLAAFSPLGYELMAAYALYRSALDFFTGRVRWLDFGGGAGLAGGGAEGLTQFKKGWSTGVRMAYLCGRILDHGEYRKLSARTGIETDYFPAYRRGELA